MPVVNTGITPTVIKQATNTNKLKSSPLVAEKSIKALLTSALTYTYM